MTLSDELAEIKALLKKLDERVSRLEGLPGPGPESRPKGLSIKEFILQKNVVTYTDMTLVVGYYLEKFERLGQFNVNDIENGFSEAKEPAPRNLNEMVNKNIGKGFIMGSGEKDGIKAWRLTSSGEAYVEKRLGEESSG